MTDQTLKEKTAKGLFWGGMNNGVQQLLGLVFGILFGRLLSPTDYGMMAMISIFTLIATALQDSGFRAAIANLKEATNRDYNSVFWFNIIVGFTLYILLYISAPLIANYYHTPELTSLSRVVFLCVIFSCLGTAQSAYLFRNLMAKQQAKAGMIAVICSNVIGIFLAWKGLAYWALAIQSITYVAINTLLLWHYSPWRPTLHWDINPIKQMFSFSYKLLLTTILERVNNNVLNILLGRFFTPHEVGNYNQAYQWDFKGFNFVQNMVGQIAQPVLASLTDEQERQLRILRKMMRFTAFVSFPLMFGLSLISKEFIVLAITDKWLASAKLLQLLCISGAFIPLSFVLSNLIISRGKSGTYLLCTLTLCITLLALMLILYPYGIRTMVIAYVCLYIFWLFVWHHLVKQLTGYTITMLLQDIAPYLIIAALIMIITYYCTNFIENLVFLLITRIVMAKLLYWLVMQLKHDEMWYECLDFIRKRRK